jgi:hypothetical protein
MGKRSIRPDRIALALVLLIVLLTSISYSALGSSSDPMCQGSAVTIFGTGGTNHLEGTPGRDVILARGGADTIEGRGGPDLICAGGGADVVRAGGGEDSVLGGKGDDLLKGGSGPDTLLAGGGKDTANGGDGADVCQAETRISCSRPDPDPEPSPTPSTSASGSPSESPASTTTTTTTTSTTSTTSTTTTTTTTTAPPGSLDCITGTDQQFPPGDTADDSNNQYDFGEVDINAPFGGTQATCTASGGSVTVASYSMASTLAPSGASGFSWGEGFSGTKCPLSTGIVLAAGQSCTITVYFGPSQPSVIDGYKATLNVSHNGSNASPETTFFEGTGVDGGD